MKRTDAPVETRLSKIYISRWAVWGLLGYTIFNLLASFCFKECGTDVEHTWHYFVLGNLFGPVSLVFLMWFYSGTNANVAAALSMGLSAVSVQVAFWLVYAVRLTPLQWVGIVLAITGAVVAASVGPRPEGTGAPGNGCREGTVP